jgi:3-oxoacyl-(acyl-carrier-protein) synthase
MEAVALRRLFPAELPPVASVKRFFGHTLAASGAIKAVLAVSTLLEQALPPSLGFAEADPNVGFAPVPHYTERPVKHLLSNSFGFGGNNVTLVFSRAECAAPRTIPPKLISVKRLAIAGAGVISAAGQSVAPFASRLGTDSVSPLPQEIAGKSIKVGAYVCGEIGVDQIEPAKRRRLSRFQQMALVAAKQSLPEAGVFNPRRVCVGFGTGFGSLKETAAFLENMILKEERAPRPLFFTNSVHNTLAAQVAMEFGYQGTNSTPVQREISFEVALWQMARELVTGRADYVLAGSADELSPYQLMAGARWGWWQEDTPTIAPFGKKLRDKQQPLAGEGCGCVMMCRSEGNAAVLGHLSAVAIGRTAVEPDGRVDAAMEAKWLRTQIERHGWPLTSVDLLLTGANGGEVDSDYAAVGRELAHLAGRQMACGAYKQWCGEFASASAIGFIVALGLVRGEIPASACVAASPQGESVSAIPRHVVLYTLARGGMKSMCGVTA